MRLGIYYSSEIYYDGICYFCNETFGRYINEIAKRVEKLVVFAPVTFLNLNEKEYIIKQTNIEVVDLPYFTSYISSFKHFVKVYQIFKANIQRVDLIWVRSAPFCYLLYKIADANRVNSFLQIVGDVPSIVRKGAKYKGLLRPFAFFYAKIEESLLRKMAQKIPIFVNGEELYKRYKKYAIYIKKITTTTLSKQDFYYRQDTCNNKKIRILFVGYLRHEKGVDYLLEAVSDLLRKGIDIEVTIVGDGPERRKLEDLTLDLGITKRVEFQGYVPLGKKLNRYYAMADIFVLPSISEGTPRVLLEAMAKGLPIIATEVGGISGLIKNGENGLLVPPADPKALAEAIEKIVSDRKLRSAIIKNGYLFAKQHLLERLMDFILDNVKKYFLFSEFALCPPPTGRYRSSPDKNLRSKYLRLHG